MGTKMTVVAFIIMPAATHSYTVEALKGQAVTKQLRDTVTEIQHHIGARLFDHDARFHGCASCVLYSDYDLPSSLQRPKSHSDAPRSYLRRRSSPSQTAHLCP